MTKKKIDLTSFEQKFIQFLIIKILMKNKIIAKKLFISNLIITIIRADNILNHFSSIHLAKNKTQTITKNTSKLGLILHDFNKLIDVKSF